MIKAIFWDFYGVINIDGEVNPEVAAFIKANNGKYKFAVLSAANSDLRPWLEEKGILDCFELVQTTKDLGVSKSDAKFYKHAMDQLFVNPEEVLFIDDIEGYLDIASRLGIRGIHYEYGKSIDNLLEGLL